MSNKPFVNLHNHSDFSLLDGAQTCQEMVERAAELGQTHVAIADHGTMRGVYRFHNACQNVGIKPIYGIEVYMCQDRHRRGLSDSEKKEVVKGISKKMEQNKAIKEFEKKLNIRERRHVCLFAKNDKGLQNLFKISSIGWLEGFYYRPRIDMEILEKYSEGIILTTACVAGILAVPILNENFEELVQLSKKLKGIFKDDLYIELMPHEFKDQITVNEISVRVARNLGIPLVATNDAHYALKEHRARHEVLLCMQSRDVWSNPKRWTFSEGYFHLQNYEDMYDLFVRDHKHITEKEIKDALDNTNELASKCNAEVHIDHHKCLMPNVDINESHKEEFSKWVLETYPEIYGG